MTPKDFLDRLRERNIPQWAFAYLAAGWLALQVLDVVAGPWGVTDGMIRTAQALLAFGFFIAVTVAWYHGEAGRQQVTGMEIVLLATLLILGGLILTAVAPDHSPDVSAEAETVQDQRRTSPSLRIAVLPTEIRTSDLSEMTWAGLVQSLLVEELATVRGLRVYDAQSLNTLIEGASRTLTPPLDALADEGVEIALRASIERTERAVNLGYLLIEAQSREVLYTDGVLVEHDSLVTRRVRQIAVDVADHLEETYGGISRRMDLAPWIEREPPRLAAQRAFLQGAEYTYRGAPGGEAHFRRALDIDPEHISARVWLISSLVQEGELDEAASHVEVLDELRDETNPFDHAMIGWAEALVDGDRENQIAHLEIALGHSPGNNILLYNLGLALARDGRYAEAIDPLRRAVDAHWRYPDLYPVYGRIAIELGEVDGLWPVLEGAVGFPSSSPYLYGILEALALFRGDQSAMERYGDLFRERIATGGVRPGLVVMVPVHRALARLARSRGRTGAELHLLRWAADADSTDLRTRAELARALASAGDREAADVHYRFVAEADELPTEAMFALAEAAELTGRREEAVRMYRAYLDGEPGGLHAIQARQRLESLARGPDGA